jgi:hypothetical protein
MSLLRLWDRFSFLLAAAWSQYPEYGAVVISGSIQKAGHDGMAVCLPVALAGFLIRASIKP